MGDHSVPPPTQFSELQGSSGSLLFSPVHRKGLGHGKAAGMDVVGGALQQHWAGAAVPSGRKAEVSSRDSPHLDGVVAQLDGLVDALHDLVEACRERKR